MSLQNVSIVLSPTMRISHRVLNILFMHSDQLFSHVKIIRYALLISFDHPNCYIHLKVPFRSSSGEIEIA